MFQYKRVCFKNLFSEKQHYKNKIFIGSSRSFSSLIASQYSHERKTKLPFSPLLFIVSCPRLFIFRKKSLNWPEINSRLVLLSKTNTTRPLFIGMQKVVERWAIKPERENECRHTNNWFNFLFRPYGAVLKYP